MPVQHLRPEDGAEAVKEALDRDGCAVVDRLASPERLRALREELDPWIEATKSGPDEFSGQHTRRTGGLIARSPRSREFLMEPLVLDAVRKVLSHVSSVQVHLTQVIAIGPGETSQAIHRDQWAFDFFPFPKGYEVQCNTLWALTDFTEQNGATRVRPGSHRDDDRLEYTVADTEPAEMEAGSVLLYTGALYHGGGANRSDAVRMGLNLTYAASFLRQEENQYLSVPHDIARELPDDLLRLMGYARGAYALGYVDDLRDPIEVLKAGAAADGFGNLDAVAQQVRSRG